MREEVASMIRLFGNRHYPIIVLVDKEDRQEDCDQLCNELHETLIKEGIENLDIRVGFADRMIENWIVADYKLLGDINNKPENTDGLKGSSVIKKCLGTYSKVIDGVNLLLSIEKQVVYEMSPSFKSFVDKLDGIECDYLNFPK